MGRDGDLLILTANVGSLGNPESLNDDDKIVASNVLGCFRSINDEFGCYPHVAGIQKDGGHTRNLAPVFNGPAATNKNYPVIADDDGRTVSRGVATFTTTEVTAVPPSPGYLGPPVEITCTIHTFRSKYSRRNKRTRGKRSASNLQRNRRVAYFNCYKNQNKSTKVGVSHASNKQITDFISKQRVILRETYHTGDIVVSGDFNDPSFKLFGLRELKNDSMYHRANPKTKKQYIDKIFTNIPTAKIIRVFQTCKNKQTVDADGMHHDDLGHKPVLISIDGDRNAQSTTKISWKKLKSLAHNFNHGANLDPEKLKNPENITKLADFLSSKLPQNYLKITSRLPQKDPAKISAWTTTLSESLTISMTTSSKTTKP